MKYMQRRRRINTGHIFSSGCGQFSCEIEKCSVEHNRCRPRQGVTTGGGQAATDTGPQIIELLFKLSLQSFDEKN